MGVVAVRHVEGRQFADGTIDIVGAIGMIARVNIGFLGEVGYGRQLHVERMNGLAADDDDFLVIRYCAGGPDDMFELSTIH